MKDTENQTPNSETSAEEHDVTKMTKEALAAKVVGLQDKLTAAKANLGELAAESLLTDKHCQAEIDRAVATARFQRGSLLVLGVDQDLSNLIDDPTVTGKIYHGVTGVTKVVGAVAVASTAYALVAGWLAKRAAIKAASHMAGIEAGNSLETAAMATAAVF
jgi:hypothetical protein